MSQRVFKSESPRETKKIASEFVNHLFACCARKKTATVVGIKGELGAGKTTFIQGMGSALSVKERITSPTFVLMKVFQASRQVPKKQGRTGRAPFQHFVHIDCWRLKDARDLAELGFETLIRDRDALVAIEWAEKVKDILPKRTIWVEIRGVSARKRSILITYPT